MAIRTPPKAVDYARSVLNRGYNGYCLAHVQDAYGAEPRYASAIAAWNGCSEPHPTTDLASAPYGAPIYFSQPGNPYGHIALHLNGDMMYTTDSSVGHPHEDSISKWVRQYGYVPLGWSGDIENQNIPELGDDDMPTANEIAEAVWNFNQNGVKMRDRVQGIDGAANGANNEIHRLSKWNDKTHASNMGNLITEQPVKYDGTTAKLGDRIGYIDAHTHIMDAQITALTEAVKTLAANQGADPDKIAAIVKQAVKEKLESLTITVK